MLISSPQEPEIVYAFKAEIENMRHDLTRQVEINAELVTENERLRNLLAKNLIDPDSN